MTTRIPLQPVDGVTVHTIMDNVSDALLAARGPAQRTRGAATAPLALTVEGRGPDSLKAEHGFSALIELESDGGRRQILFDTGVSATANGPSVTSWIGCSSARPSEPMRNEPPGSATKGVTAGPCSSRR